MYNGKKEKETDMKKLTIFHLDDCPYCHNARRALEELIREHPAYGEIGIEWIEESRQPELADAYDYYYVPAVFAGREKLCEARPGESFAECRQKLRAALDAVGET